jgi:imidazolonepropionase-like amidohydrolase
MRRFSLPVPSRGRRWLSAAGWWLPIASLVALLPLAAAAEPPEPPPYYAIRDARVIVGNGETLERATVLLADGLVEAVGPDLPIPPDAWVIEGEGRVVVPGLIDALTDLGQAPEKEAEGGSGGARGPEGPPGRGGDRGPEIRGPEDRPGTTPWRAAADLLGEDGRVEKWREAGFTAAVTAPDEGLFTGQAALIDLGRGEPREQVVATPVAQRLNLRANRGFRTFPSSLMGVIAYLRQTISDTRHYAEVQALYAADPAGRERPAYDRALDPLAEALASGLPFLMPGNLGREIDRVLALEAELDLPVVLYGGQGAYERAAQLEAAGVPVVVSLDWPEEEKDRDPDADTPFRDLVHQRLAPTTPRVLAEAGVPFAFTSDGLASPSEVFASLRKAVEAGLGEGAALRALSSGAAEIFGVADRVGTVEAGKIANLVLATDLPWAEDAEIEAVFVDGRKVVTQQEDEEAGEPPARAEPKEDEADQGGGEGESPEPAVSDEELRRALALYQGPVREMGTFAVTHATVWTVSGETLDDATVVVAHGKIQAVGADVPIPRGAEILDAAGGHLIPGIFDAHSHIAIEGGVNEGTLAVTSMVGIEDVIDPDDIAIYRALAGGVTAANLLHGSANPIGGKNAVIKLRWGHDAAGLLFDGAPPGIKFALGENPKRSNFRIPGVERYPGSRMGVMDVIRQAFTEAREYQRTWSEYEQAAARRERPLPPRRDFELEALVEILDGKRRVHSHCYRADEILQLMRLAEDFGFRVATLQHVLEGYKVADEIAAHGAGASTFSDWWGYKMEAYDAIPYNAALMTERGVVVSINSDSAEEMRHLNQEAAKAIHWGGMSEIEALKMVTLNPAIQLGVADRVGSIEAGKDADLVLYDGNPLSVLSVVQKTFVDGDLYFDREADRERQARIEEIEKRLAGEDDEESEEGEVGADGSSYVSSRNALWQDFDSTYSCREDH